MRNRLLLAITLLVTTAAIASDRTSYILRRGDNSTMHIEGDISKLDETKRFGREYLWFERGGRAYVIRDAATLAEAHGLFAEVEALGARIEKITQRMEPFTSRMEKLADRMSTLAMQLTSAGAEAQRRSLESQMEELEEEMEVVEEKMKVVERELDGYDDRIERASSQAETKLERLIDRALASGVAQRVP